MQTELSCNWEVEKFKYQMIQDRKYKYSLLQSHPRKNIYHADKKVFTSKMFGNISPGDVESKAKLSDLVLGIVMGAIYI